MHTYSRKMKTASKQNLDVFEFKDEIEVPEFSLKIKSKGENPRNAIDKYTFLATAASGKNFSTEEINYVSSLDIDTININHIATTLVQDSSTGMTADSNDASTVAEQCPQSRTDLSELDFSAPAEAEVNVVNTSLSPRNDKLNPAILDLLPSLPEFDETVKMDLDENGSMCGRSLSSNDVAEDDGVGPSSDHCIDGWEMDSEDTTTVVFYPDYVVYHDSYYTDSVISFSDSFIEMEGSTSDGDDETFSCKWAIDDIIHIRSHLYEGVEMAMVNILVCTKGTGHSGTELKFAVIGSSWYERLEAITHLNDTYKDLWRSMLESEDTLLGHNGVSFSKYLPNFDRPFEEVVYPKGDADAVSISKGDFDLLQPDTFVNDTIIDFYIKYLKNKINPDERHRFHFFNSFFFRKLADPDKGPLDASDGTVAYQRVKKWTRKVNLFQKDYVFIPVNYKFHWSLIVMCHIGEVATYEDSNESIKVPCVLHMDSIRGSHTGLKGLVQSYLKEEWKARQEGEPEDVSSRFDNLRFISLELPQQQNSYDCGLFLLHYVQLFLEQVPLHFNPFEITKYSDFLNVDWFPPAEASLKRVVIQKLICDLLENPYQESSTTAGNDQQCHLSYPTTNVHKGSFVNLSVQDYNPSMHHQSVDDPTVDLEPSFGSEPFLGTQFSDFNRTTTFDVYNGSLPTIEEDGERFVYSQTNCGPQQDNYSSQDFPTQEPWHDQVNNNFESSSEASVSETEGSIKIVNENSQLDSEKDQPRSSSVPDILSEFVQMVDNGDDVRFLDMQVTGGLENPELESDVQHPTKKMRMTET